MKTIVKKAVALTSALVATTVSASDWVSLPYGGDRSVVYESSLIKESGFFSKDFEVWLRATHQIEESQCGIPPPKNGQSIRELAGYGYCISALMKRPKEEVYRVGFNCKRKVVFSWLSSSTNIKGEATPSTLQILSHPGSLGNTLLEYYCN